MAIFSRRVLQRILNENARILSGNQVGSHIKRLNRMHRSLKLGDEWEVVLLNAFSKIGKVTHEEGPAGTSDLYFESQDDPSIKFLAEITAVSDEGFKKFGDFDQLDEELRRRLKKRGLNPGYFHLDVQGNHQEIQRGRYYWERNDEALWYGRAIKAKLYMPIDSNFERAIFNENWERFLDEITGANEIKTYTVYRPEEQINLTISYDPGKRYGSGGHLAHKQINHLTNNRIYGELTKKASQLAKAKFVGNRGIIICDGGYTPFHSMKHFSTHSIREVITCFLKNNPSVSFVFTIVIKRDSYPRVPNVISTQPYVNDVIGGDANGIIESIDRAIEFLPRPVSDAFNAVNQLKSGNGREGRKNGALTMSSNEIKISSRTVMELLSGRMTHADFMSLYENISSGFTPGYTNFFDMKLRGGMMISNIQLEKSDTIDDDVITIRWAGPDPAISRFVQPE